jgi:hypothetical protein
LAVLDRSRRQVLLAKETNAGRPVGILDLMVGGEGNILKAPREIRLEPGERELENR